MNVICKKSNSKLIKGYTYNAILISNSDTTKRKILVLEGIHSSYSCLNFTKMDGSPIDKMEWKDEEYKKETFEKRNSYLKDTDNIQPGDIVVCRSNSLRNLISGNKYQVSDVRVTESEGYGGRKWERKSIKVDGYNRWISPYNFRRISLQESREMSLGKLLHNKKIDLKVSKDIRKIDMLGEKDKNKIILKILFESISNEYRKGTDVIQWAIERNAYKLTKEDFAPFLKQNINILSKEFN